MTTASWVLTLAAVAVAGMAAAALAAVLSWRDGCAAGRIEEKNARNLGLIRARRAAADREADDFTRWCASLREDDGERLADTGEMQQLAAEWPLIGEVLAGAPARSARDTGSFRAATDDYIGRMAAEEDAYRKGLSS
jgi:hypothetical protein